jgi:hypothetical protein
MCVRRLPPAIGNEQKACQFDPRIMRPPLLLTTMAQRLMVIGRRRLEGGSRRLQLSTGVGTMVGLGMIRPPP